MMWVPSIHHRAEHSQPLTGATLTLRNTVPRLFDHSSSQCPKHCATIPQSLIPPSVPPAAGYLLSGMLVADGPVNQCPVKLPIPHKSKGRHTGILHMATQEPTHVRVSETDTKDREARNRCEICESDWVTQAITHFSHVTG